MMSLITSQGDCVTVITVTTNPKSKWPLLCQILGKLCCGPVCSVAPKLKGKLTETQTALGVIQLLVEVLNIVLGIILASFDVVLVMNAAFGLGCLFLPIGIMCILAAKFPSPCLVVITLILNFFGVGLAITAVVMYSLDLAVGNFEYCGGHYYPSYGAALSPEQEQKNTEICLYYRHLNQMIFGGLDIMLIVSAVLQLCVTISFCVLTLKALCKKSAMSQLHKPLLEDAAVSPAC